jgi:hypothetical protein
MGGREQGAQGGPLQIAADGRALRPGGVQDGQDILHGVLQDDRSGRVIREPGIALVEHDQPRERRQTRIPADQTRPLVVLLQMRGERRNQHQVHRSVTEHAIGDVDTRHCSHTEPRNQSPGHHEPRHPPDLRLHRVAWIAGCLSSGEVAHTSKSASGHTLYTARDRKAEDETCRRLMQHSALSQVEQQVGRQRRRSFPQQFQGSRPLLPFAVPIITEPLGSLTVIPPGGPSPRAHFACRGAGNCVAPGW